MKCFFCGGDTGERVNSGNIVIIAHRYCILDRMEEMGTDSVYELIQDDEVKIYEPMRKEGR